MSCKKKRKEKSLLTNCQLSLCRCLSTISPSLQLLLHLKMKTENTCSGDRMLIVMDYPFHVPPITASHFHTMVNEQKIMAALKGRQSIPV